MTGGLDLRDGDRTTIEVYTLPVLESAIKIRDDLTNKIRGLELS